MKYFTGDSIPITFEIKMDGKRANLMRAVVEVFSPNSIRILEDTAATKLGEVSYSLPGEYTQEHGQYNFIFRLTIRGYGDFSHIVKRDVRKLYVKNKAISRIT